MKAWRNSPARLCGNSGIGRKRRKPFAPKTTKTSPSKIRTMIVTIFMAAFMPDEEEFARPMGEQNRLAEPLLSRQFACHPERSAAESKDPAEVTLKVAQRDPSTALGMT